MCHKKMSWLKDYYFSAPAIIERIRQSWYCYNCHKWLSDLPELPKRPKMSPTERKKIIQASPICTKCGAIENLTIDHKHPTSMGGLDTPCNLQVHCRSCNASKGYAIQKIGA